MPYTVRENDIFVEVSHYHLKNDNKSMLSEEENRLRDTEYESIQRSKRLVIEYALNNPWTHFFTITLDRKKVGDRTAYQFITEKLFKLFDNQKQRNNKELSYLLIAEAHKRLEKNNKNAIHYHGLLNIDSINKLKFGDQFEYKNKKGITCFAQESKLIRNSFGKNTFTKIYDTKEFLAYYVSKYITKAFKENTILLGKRFYKSQNLSLSKSAQYDDLKEFHGLGIEPTYKNRYTTKWRITKEEYHFYKEKGILPKL